MPVDVSHEANEAVREFVRLVKNYIELAEHVEQPSAHEFLSRCAIILPQLYATGHCLPDVEPSGEEGTTVSDSEEREHRDREALLRQKVASLLRKYDMYAEVFDPVFEKEVVTGLLSNDLSEVYADLREPFLLYERGNSRDAIWDWKFGLQFHYGHHIVDALRVIHQLITDHMPSDWRNS